MARHGMKTLVRVWQDFTTELESQYVDWDNGSFILEVDDPAQQALFWSKRDLRLSVYNTDDLIWVVRRVDINPGAIRVYCEPFIDYMRRCILPDSKLIGLWLNAERQHA